MPPASRMWTRNGGTSSNAYNQHVGTFSIATSSSHPLRSSSFHYTITSPSMDNLHQVTEFLLSRINIITTGASGPHRETPIQCFLPITQTYNHHATGETPHRRPLHNDLTMRSQPTCTIPSRKTCKLPFQAARYDRRRIYCPENSQAHPSSSIETCVRPGDYPTRSRHTRCTSRRRRSRQFSAMKS